MALDGIFLHKLSQELSAELIGSRVEKIYQPSKDELVFVMRTKAGAKKLYFNSRADGARVHISKQNFINPQNPLMLCMLLRKRFSSAWLDAITQTDYERILRFQFSALNDFGDRVPLNIYCEIMGRYSNLIFTDENGLIIDCMKRVGSNLSSVRELLPGKTYKAPPAQDKIILREETVDLVLQKILENPNALLSKALLKSLKGFSPLLCNEIAFRAFGEDVPVYQAAESISCLRETLVWFLSLLKEPIHPCILSEGSKQVAFSFFDIAQFGNLCSKKFYPTLSALSDAYFVHSIQTVKRTQSGGELLKKVHALIEKTTRKIALQQKELEACADSEQLKLFGELINASLYYLDNKVSSYRVLNYYTGEEIDIPVDILLTPAENAAKYYKEYRKKQNALIYISEQIEKGKLQLDYLESVLDILERAESFEEIQALKSELISQGYLKAKTAKKQREQKPLKPLRFKTQNGFEVLVGRNNLSNEKLSFKSARGSDLWFHTKNVHGSHTVLFTEGREPEPEDIIQAAGICAYYSKAREADHVAVDYTFIKFVKRRPGGIPGSAVYTDYQTVFVNPDRDEVEALKF